MKSAVEDAWRTPRIPEFTAVKFCKVELPVARSVASDVAPVTFRLFPTAKFVVVAFEVVEFCAVTFWRVEDE